MHGETERTPTPAEQLDVRVVAAEDTTVERLLQSPDRGGDGTGEGSSKARRHTL